MSFFLDFFFFFFFCRINGRSDESSCGTWGSFRNTQTMMRAKRHLFFSHIHYIFSITHPTTQQLSAFPSSNSLKVSDAHNSTMPRCCPLALYPPLNPELSFITFLWSWEWKRWDKGEKRGGAESNMAAYLEDFLYWNMCKQFTHKGLK